MGDSAVKAENPLWQDAEKASVLTHPPLVRQDAPFTGLRSRLESILNVAHLGNELSWQLGMGG